MAINEKWHKSHLMPKNASMDERVKWHIEHAKECGCREIPESVKKELASRRIKFRK